MSQNFSFLKSKKGGKGAAATTSGASKSRLARYERNAQRSDALVPSRQRHDESEGHNTPKIKTVKNYGSIH